jgi:hypothetical protein
MRYIPSKLGISNFNWTYICVTSNPKKKESDFSKLELHLITARKEN